MIDSGRLIGEILDIVVLVHRDAQWQAELPLPPWFRRTMLGDTRDAERRSFRSGDVASDFFEFVLEGAMQLDAVGQDNHASEVWTENAPDGEVAHFAADARLWRGERVVLVRRLGADFEARVQRMQAAREALLTSERLEAEVFRRTHEIRHREEEIALRLLAAAGAHDTETGAHVRRIGLYSAAMAEALGWPAEKVAELRLAAPMHDVGKIGIPDRVLKKPGRLGGEEWAIMQTHTRIGADILACDDVPLLALAADIAHAHHECYDGSGYPRGLKGDEIPIGARIVTIVDVYDALVHKRVYKPAFDEDAVIAHMRGLSGTRFDPHLLEVFFAQLPAMRKIREANPDTPVPGEAALG